jgi:hypothetical protein
MEQVTRPKGTGAEYMTELAKKPGYKPAEAEDRDLQMLMALPQMQRAEFMEKLKAQANKYPLKMRELGEGQTHHGQYTLPGGENYREILLHTPNQTQEKIKELSNQLQAPMLMPEKIRAIQKELASLRQMPDDSFGGNPAHFGGMPNILASVRVKDRMSPEGKKILHLEEIQSDWHQQGREHGYLPKDLNAQIKAAKAEKKMMDRYLKDADEDSSGMVYGEYGRMVDDHQAATEKLDKLEQLRDEGVPHGPHAKDWHELALKAMIQHAAENGYDQIAVTPGAEQARRYSLSKQVGAVSYNPETQHFQAFKPNRETITNEKGATPERVKALIGKEAAEKLMQAPKQMGHHYLEGNDLDMGGEGMKGFYDKMVPTFLNKFGKKHGVQVQPGAITVPEGIESGWATKVKPAYEAPVHTFDITPQMREDVVKNGIPRYAEGGDVDNKAKFLEGSHTQQRLYHGTTATEGNKGKGKGKEAIRNLKASKEGALGSGVYMTPNPEFASEYANTSGGNVLPVHARITNPLVIHSKRGQDPMIMALVQLGMTPDKATSMVEKAYEQKGYIGKQVQQRAQAAGHDALLQYRDGDLSEVVHYNPRMIKSATGNRGTYDTSKDDLSMAKGGSIKPVGHAVVKEKVTISPNMDAMQYELMGVKHFTKKVK